MKSFTFTSKTNSKSVAAKAMRISLYDKRFFRASLLAVIAMASYWLCSAKGETARREFAAEERPPMFVLQVGIGKYLHAPTWATLAGSVNDVTEMRKVLESERYKVPTANIITLKDAEGTKANIFAKFRTHLIDHVREYYEKTKRRDAVAMFEFSGHGSQVPDVDGDEKDDHKDETLVTYDSQDAPGKNFDITDDEIFALTGELKRYTDNIIYVFDSCHSGSGTRDAEDVRRLPERKTVPVPVAGVGTSTRSGTDKPADDPATGVMPPGDDYIVITAARSGELASQRNCFEECGSSTRPIVFGNLTFYLVDELKRARSDTSYRELMQNVARRVNTDKPTQTPQLEGDGSRFVFSGLGSKEDSFTAITEGEAKPLSSNRTVKIAAGAMQGITPGTVVWFFDKSVTRFVGAPKIASGSVASVTASDSVVQLVTPKREITVADKARIITPEPASLRLKVNLEKDAAKLSPAQRNVIAGVRGNLEPRPNESVRAVYLPSAQSLAAGDWDVAVLQDNFSTVAAKVKGLTGCGKPDDPDTAPGTPVFYLAGKDYAPLYRFCVEATVGDKNDEAAKAQQIADALVHIARLRSINSIANAESPLNGKVVVRPIRLTGPFGCTDGKFQAAQSEAAVADPSTGRYKFAPRDVFWFEVTNNSPVDLYIALLNMPPDGSVKLFSPRNLYSEKDSGVLIEKNGGKRIIMSAECRTDDQGNVLDVGALRASRRPGLDTFKFLVSVDVLKRENFNFLEMPALTLRTDTLSLATPADWTTIETIFEINDTGN